jgi:hypothetical protein
VAAPIGNDAFLRTWTRTDQPVAALETSRTWMWGPQANTRLLSEPFTDSPAGRRTVQYFDRSRMEITNPAGDPGSLWYVTNGLLAKELVTGALQTGPDSFEQHAPSQSNVSGDPGDATAPTYASFKSLLESAPLPVGRTIIQTVDRSGHTGDDPSLVSLGITAAAPVAETNHTVASVLWDFMNSSGRITENGEATHAPLFQNPFYATGYPITEAYWSTVLVNGALKRVLIQVFERRVLTYTPDNPDGWKVEAGNVGQHYYLWRYGQPVDPPESPAPSPSPTPTPSPTPSPSPSQFQVTYRVSGYSANIVQVKYITAQGGSVQQDLPYVDSNIGRDWQKSGTFHAGDPAQVSAYLQPYQVYDEATQTWRTQAGTGGITCEIFVNGEVWRTASASGANAGITCTGTIGGR